MTKRLRPHPVTREPSDLTLHRDQVGETKPAATTATTKETSPKTFPSDPPRPAGLAALLANGGMSLDQLFSTMDLTGARGIKPFDLLVIQEYGHAWRILYGNQPTKGSDEDLGCWYRAMVIATELVDRSNKLFI